MSENVSRWVGDAFQVALITAAGFWIAFSYEEGYCSHFRIPSALISLETPILIQSIGSLLAVMAIVFMIASGLPVWSPNASPFRRKVQFVYLPFVFYVLTLFVIGASWVAIIVSSTFFVMMFALDIGFAKLNHPNLQSFAAKWEAQEELEEKQRKKYLSAVVHDLLGTHVVITVCVLLLLHALANFKGSGDAARQKWFLVAGDNAILRIYGDRMIQRPIDSKEHTVGNELRIVDVCASGQSLAWKKIGPLRTVEID